MAEAYAEAAELYSKALLELHGDKGVLYYNRELCWERQNVTKNAVADLRLALAAESSPLWRKAIQAEIDKLSAHSSMVDPAEDFTATLQGSGMPAGMTRESYEDALEHVTEQLLPRWQANPAVRASISGIAQAGLRHHDRWLEDWITAATAHFGAKTSESGPTCGSSFPKCAVAAVILTRGVCAVWGSSCYGVPRAARE